MAGGIVKLGIWYDYEEEGVWGWNLTVTGQQATVITALLALGLQLTGSHSWKIIRFILHHHRRHDQPRDAMIREQEVILRNEASDVGTVFGLASVLWSWRLFGRLIPGDVLKASRLSTWMVIVSGLVHWLVFLFLATFVPVILSKGMPNPPVLLEDLRCLLPFGRSDIFNSNLTITTKERPGHSAAVGAFRYYDTCYREGGYAVECTKLANRRIPWKEDQEDVSCPFGPEACLGGARPISFDTGHVSPALFGINHPISRKVTIRRLATCTPLRPDTFLASPDDAVEGYRYYNFSPEAKPYWSKISGNTDLNLRIGPSSRGDYELAVMVRTTYLYSRVGFVHASLNRSDAEVAVVVINKERVRYSEEVNDAVYGAHTRVGKARNSTGPLRLPIEMTPNSNRDSPADYITSLGTHDDNWYYPDSPVSMIGCADQVEVCYLPKGACTGLKSVPVDFLQEFMERPIYGPSEDVIGMIPSSGLRYVTDVYLGNSIGFTIQYLGPQILSVRRYDIGLGNGIQDPPSDNLWEEEARSWFGAALAKSQLSVLQNTPQFFAPNKRSGYSQELASLRGNYSDGKDCYLIKARSSEHATLSVAGLTIATSLCGVLFVLSSLDGVVQRGLFRRRPHQVLAWELDSAQQLVRQLHEHIKAGVFRPAAVNAVPTAFRTLGIPSLQRRNGSVRVASYAASDDGGLKDAARTMTRE